LPQYILDDTIAAISTPYGHSAIGVVRLSGPACAEILSRIFTPVSEKTPKTLKSHMLTHGCLHNGANNAVDDAMAAYLEAPNSFTGQDMAEIYCHGSPVVLNQALELCLRNGARLACPGEFTYRAYINEKLDLAKAEAVADLIMSKTDLSSRLALRQLKGELSERIGRFRDKLIELLAEVETAIDHSEEDIQLLSRDEAKEKLKGLSSEITNLAQTYKKGRFLKTGVSAAIIGRTNVGKSSLLNALLEKERAIVTDIPGTTRDTIEETIELKGIPVKIIDTAGIREHSQDPVEFIGQEKTRQAISEADTILWVMDLSRDLNREDEYIYGLLKQSEKLKNTIAVLNKTDKPKKLCESGITDLCKVQLRSVKASALKKEGIAGIEQAIMDSLGLDSSLDESITITSARHTDALHRSNKSLLEAIGAAEKLETEEIIAFHVREALDALGEITGQAVTDEILDAIFSKFCIGK
jgi:tRNA modification GTPase